MSLPVISRFAVQSASEFYGIPDILSATVRIQGHVAYNAQHIVRVEQLQ